MGFKEFAQNVKNLIASRAQSPEDTPDDQTTDKYLRSLRRQRRLQLEEIEKSRLKKKIAAFERQRTNNYLYGLKEKKKLQKKSMITNGFPLLNKRKPLGGKYRLK